MDWDKLRIFQAAADAGSFTHAGETLGLSQSAVSRQVGALEADLGAPLFHRHARGLILTEQGEMLLGAVRDVVLKLDAVRSRLIDSRERPTGELRITTTLGLGANWLAPRLGEFVDLYPEVKLQLLLSDEELDIGMREADVALRLREPSQPDLIRRRLFTVHFHAYASSEYLKKRPQPRKPEDLDYHHLVAFGAATATHLLYDLNSLLAVGRDPKNPRVPQIAVNNLSAMVAGGGERGRHRRAARLCRAAGHEPCAAVAADRHAADGLLPRVRRRVRRPSPASRPSATFSSQRPSGGDTDNGADPGASAALPALANAMWVDEVRRPKGPPRMGDPNVADEDQKAVLPIHGRADDRDRQIRRIADRARKLVRDQSKRLDVRKIRAANPQRPDWLVRNDGTHHAPRADRQPRRSVGKRALRLRNEAADMDVKLVLSADEAGIGHQRDLVAPRRSAVPRGDHPARRPGLGEIVRRLGRLQELVLDPDASPGRRQDQVIRPWRAQEDMTARLALGEVDGETGERQARQPLVGDTDSDDLPKGVTVGCDREGRAGDEREYARDEPDQPASRARPCRIHRQSSTNALRGFPARRGAL